MLKQLRSRKTMKLIMKIALFLVIPSFIGLYGWSSIRRGPQGGGGDFYRIKIKDHPLQLKWTNMPESELKMARDDLLAQYQQTLGVRNPEMMRMAENLVTPRLLSYQAIENHELYKMADKKGLQATMPELKNQISAVTTQIQQMYPNAGLTKKDALDTMMRMEGYAPSQEEAYVQHQLYRMTMSKAQFLYGMRSKTSLFELWQDYLLAEEKVKVAYVKINASDLEDEIELTDAEISDYFQENREDYRVPDKNRFEYILMRKYDVIQKVEAPEEEVKEYYEENRETEFKQERQVKVRQIMVEIPQDAEEERIVEIEARAEDLYSSITVHGADFAYVADQYSDDPANSEPVIGPQGKPTDEVMKKGGLLDQYWSAELAERSIYGENVVSAALSMKKGEISEPVRGDRGFHILKIEDEKEERIIPFEEAREQAQRRVRERIGTKRFEDMKTELNRIYDQTTTLSGLATQLGLEIQETPLVRTNATYIPGVGNVASFSDRLNDLEEGQMTVPLLNDNMAAVLLLKETVPSHIPDLEEVRDKARRDAVTARAVEKAEETAEKLANGASSPEELKAAAEKLGLEFNETDSFTHASPPQELARVKDLDSVTVRTKAGVVKKSPILKGYAGDSFSGYAVWTITEKIEPDKAQFKEDLGRIQRDAVMAKQRTILNESLADLREEAEYVINPDFLQARR